MNWIFVPVVGPTVRALFALFCSVLESLGSSRPETEVSKVSSLWETMEPVHSAAEARNRMLVRFMVSLWCWCLSAVYCLIVFDVYRGYGK